MKVRLALVSVAVGAVAWAAVPANAAPGTFTVTGGGTISPGLQLAAPGSQSFTFSGSGYGTSGTYLGPISCTWSGNDTVGTLAQGAGSFSGTCTPLAGTEPITGTYSRSLGSVTMSGRIGPAPFVGNFTAACVFAPGPPPSTAYQESCTFTVQ
ncbi:MAG: hypothetical protein JO074_08895 [Frankiales bacterium]|nr:hypothetical protein [Frankiales bacterium]